MFDVLSLGPFLVFTTHLHYSFVDWQAAVRCIAQLDCLMSLANYSLSAAAVTCRPVFYPLDATTKVSPP